MASHPGRYRFPLLILALLAVAPVHAQDRFAAIPAKIQPFVDQGEISGAVMLVADRDHVLHLSAVGVSDLSSGRRMKTDDIFWIASMSKPMTAVCIGMLADQGLLSFDDPVEKYLPEFHGQWVVADMTAEQRLLVKASRPITIRDLLTHTSGLGEYAVTDPHWTLAEFVKVVAREPLRFQPGSRWGYSTAGFDTLGRIVEVVSGIPFAEFMQHRLFDPLGMAQTTFWPTQAESPRLAHEYLRDYAVGKLEETPIHYLYGGAVTDRMRPALGGAGLFSTAEDVARFYQMLLHGGELNGNRILKAATVAEMTRKQTGELLARPGMPWGLGFCLIEDPVKMEANSTLTPGTFGHGGAFGTQSWDDPTRGIVYVFMIQRDKMKVPNPDNSPMRRAYQDAVAEALDSAPSH
jgi:CubicO group peptidase (beta-lactamase class C family)